MGNRGVFRKKIVELKDLPDEKLKTTKSLFSKDQRTRVSYRMEGKGKKAAKERKSSEEVKNA